MAPRNDSVMFNMDLFIAEITGDATIDDDLQI